MHPAGDKEAVDKAFGEADHVVSQEFVINRITANSMEGRGCIAEYDKYEDRYILNAGAQGPHTMRQILAMTLGVNPDKIRIIAEDMGGGFGTRELYSDGEEKLFTPDLKFYRRIGDYADQPYSVKGEKLTEEEYKKHREEVFPNEADFAALKDIFKDNNWIEDKNATARAQ